VALTDVDTRPSRSTSAPPPKSEPPKSLRKREQSAARAVLQFTVAGVAALIVVGTVFIIITRRLSLRDALQSAQDIAEVEARLAVEPRLTPEVISEDPAALAEFDQWIRSAVISDRTVRVKILNADSRIIYSDAPSQIGEFHDQGEDHDALNQDERVAHVDVLWKFYLRL
jgi:hypothetical protein